MRFVALLILSIVFPLHAEATTTVLLESEQCEKLAQEDFSTLPEASTKITSAHIVGDLEELLSDLKRIAPGGLVTQVRLGIPTSPTYCRVRGFVASQVGFELLLPIHGWNGKFLHIGCGGWCGNTALVAASCTKHWGYACVGTDMGHQGAGGTWFRNNLQAQIDFSYRATHVATLAGKAITERYYTKPPRKSYFIGCSTGGYQGLTEAQRYPQDFDGIVAGAPDMDEADLAVRGIWIKQHLMGADDKPILNPTEIELLHKAALARCDMDDGIKDGIISDPAHCGFDPVSLLCKSPHKAGSGECLSSAQVEAVRAIYGAPRNSKGVALSTRGVFPGSERNWLESFAKTWGEIYFEDTAVFARSGSEWTYADFNFDTDYPKSGAGTTFIDTNPDLRRFKAAGGKMITYQGGSDALEIPGAIVDYYEIVEKTMGGRAATQDFFRLFVVPAMNHCSEGDGPYAIDHLAYLEAWVEEGHAPDKLLGAHVRNLQDYGSYALRFPLDSLAEVDFTRPIYPYPEHPIYKGHGDPARADSFESSVK